MKQRPLGRSGLPVSVVGLGCNNFGWRIDLEASRKVVDQALELGITLLDTADIYGNLGGSEEALGQVLGDPRNEIVLATKFGVAMARAERFKGATRRYIMRAVEGSLKPRKPDWTAPYQGHRPHPLRSMEEQLPTLDDPVRRGKVPALGCSTYAGWRVVQAASTT